jgi:DNA-binding LacI/PurR family transcriptional regulator
MTAAVCDARFVYPVTEQRQDGNGGSRPRPASIRDVARLAGVSHQTVSRVLNGHPSIRDVTKSRVLAAMDQLQFRPSRAARMLSMRRSQTIGILAAAVGSHYGPASSVSAVEDAARDRGYYATVAHLASVAPSAITAAIEELLSQEVEGIVIVAPRTSVLSRLAELRMTVPIVAAQGEPRDAGGIPVATVDQEAGVRLVLDYLVSQGHKRILHVAGPRDWNDAQSRLRAFKAGLRAAGLVWSPPLYGDWTSDSGYAIGRALVQEAKGGEGTGGEGTRDEGTGGADGRRPPLPFTAVFAANDQMALGVIHALREAGLDVPRDVSIVGFDDIPESAHFWPPLTTVRQDFGDLGVRCVTMLLDLIQGTGPAAVAPAAAAPVVQPQLIIRSSVAAI